MNLQLILRRFVRGFEVTVDELEALAGKLRWSEGLCTVTVATKTFEVAKMPVLAFLTHARGRVFPGDGFYAQVVTAIYHEDSARVDITLKRKTMQEDAA